MRLFLRLRRERAVVAVLSYDVAIDIFFPGIMAPALNIFDESHEQTFETFIFSAEPIQSPSPFCQSYRPHRPHSTRH